MEIVRYVEYVQSGEASASQEENPTLAMTSILGHINNCMICLR